MTIHSNKNIILIHSLFILNPQKTRKQISLINCKINFIPLKTSAFKHKKVLIKNAETKKKERVYDKFIK